MTLTRRQFLLFSLRTTAVVSLAGAGTAAYAARIEPYQVETTYVSLPLRRLPNSFIGYRLVQISDLHMGGWMTADRMIDIVEEINRLDADAIMITGDFVTTFSQEVAAEIVDVLSPLQAKDGIFAVLGNHDHWTDPQGVSQAVEGAGIHLLTNKHSIVRRGEDALYFAGVDDPWSGQPQLEAALNGAAGPTILMAHEPDYADIVAAHGGVDVQLSGHTHGGQVRLPFVGAPVLPPLGEKYDMGLFTVGELKLYVNRGLGMVEPAVRFACPPEITVFEMQGTS